MLSKIEEIHARFNGFPFSMFGSPMELLLDNEGNILDLSLPGGFRFPSMVDEIRRAGNVREYFSIPRGRLLSGAVAEKAGPYATFHNRRDFLRLESPEEFYSVLPTAILCLIPVEKDRFYGVVRVLDTVPDIYLQKPSGILYVNQDDRLAGFNRTFYNFFSKSFAAPEDLLNRPLSDFLNPSPREIQQEYLANLPLLPPSSFEERFSCEFGRTLEAGGVRFSRGALFRVSGEGLFFSNETEDFAFFTLPCVFSSNDDFSLEIEFKRLAGEDPPLLLGGPQSEGRLPDYDGYLAGLQHQRDRYMIKRTGVLHAIGEAAGAEPVKRLRLLKSGKGLFLFEGKSRKAAFYDFYFLATEEARVSVGLRRGSSCLIRRLRLGSRKADQLKTQGLTPIVRLNTPAQHYFALNRLSNIKISMNFPEAAAYVLEDVTEMQKQVHTLRSEVGQLLRETGRLDETLVGESRGISTIREKAAIVADSDVTILIEGETGTGKEVLAKFVHQNSGRSEAPFIKVDCSTLPRALMEAELFGHEKGAFTGALERRFGRFEQADNGTLFLDEVGNLSLETQAKLLQFMQDRAILRVGGSSPIPLNVRIIVASNSPLRALVDRGLFRSDLFFRMDVVRIRLPPLRERREDIRDLCAHFIRSLRDLHRTPAQRLSAGAFRKLFQHDWPGNVRELKNTLERAVLFCTVPEIPPDLISFEASSPAAGVKKRKPHRRVNKDIGVIRKLLNKHKGIMKKAAQELGVDPRTVYYWMEREGYSIKKLRKNG